MEADRLHPKRGHLDRWSGRRSGSWILQKVFKKISRLCVVLLSQAGRVEALSYRRYERKDSILLGGGGASTLLLNGATFSFQQEKLLLLVS